MSNYCQNCYELTEEISKLKAENIHLCEYKDELQVKLEKIKEYANQLEIFVHIKEDLLNIIEGAEDE